MEKFREISEDICFIAPEVSQFLKLRKGTIVVTFE